ncbi:UNVERIFIED_CONTAM: Potassium voltage-gated channel subfamily H member 6 [Gekko kuhli]
MFHYLCYCSRKNGCLARLVLCLAQTPLDVSNLFTFWEDKRPQHFPEPLQHMSLVHNPLDVCSSPDDRRPQQVESKLECLQAQLSR